MLESAIEALNWGEIAVVARSSVYETAPVGGPPGQPSFLNMVIAVETSLEPRALLDRCQAVEGAFGRRRAHEQRWGPRPIDVDLLTYGDRTIGDEDLTVPHPRMAERAFVLVPLAEIAPDLLVPGLGLVSSLLARISPAGVVRTE